MTEAWANFFIAQCGASAALLGLLFVSVSLNLARILSFPQLPDRALVVLLLLFAVLVLSSLMLMPGQPIGAIGVEVLAIGAVICGLTSALGIRSTRRAPADLRWTFARHMALLWVATLPYLVAGILLTWGSAVSGFYWLAAAMMLSFVKSVADAWVLLVEINR
jgi:hypothetical protein